MTRRGKPTMVVWNHADPVLRDYAPGGIEMAYYNLTVDTLRRGSSSVPDVDQQLPTARPVTEASLLTFNEDAAAAPLLQVVSWRTQPGRHTWASPSWTNSLDATKQLVDFFFGKKVVGAKTDGAAKTKRAVGAETNAAPAAAPSLLFVAKPGNDILAAAQAGSGSTSHGR